MTRPDRGDRGRRVGGEMSGPAQTGGKCFVFIHDCIAPVAGRIDRVGAAHALGSSSHVARVRCVPAVRVVSHGSCHA